MDTGQYCIIQYSKVQYNTVQYRHNTIEQVLKEDLRIYPASWSLTNNTTSHNTSVTEDCKLKYEKKKLGNESNYSGSPVPSLSEVGTNSDYPKTNLLIVGVFLACFNEFIYQGKESWILVILPSYVLGPISKFS